MFSDAVKFFTVCIHFMHLVLFPCNKCTPSELAGKRTERRKACMPWIGSPSFSIVLEYLIVGIPPPICTNLVSAWNIWTQLLMSCLALAAGNGVFTSALKCVARCTPLWNLKGGSFRLTAVTTSIGTYIFPVRGQSLWRRNSVIHDEK